MHNSGELKKTSKPKIGLFGGSFDPIHNGHLQIATVAQEQLLIDKIFFIPAAIPPHKQHITLTHEKHRLRMVQLAVDGYNNFNVSDLEIKRKGISYTIDTLKIFHERYKLTSDQFFLIIGADSLIDFHKWLEPETILQICKVVVYQRADADLDSINEKLKKQVSLLDAPFIEISSTSIRNKIRAGESLSAFIPEKVVKYILVNRLYK